MICLTRSCLRWVWTCIFVGFFEFFLANCMFNLSNCYHLPSRINMHNDFSVSGQQRYPVLCPSKMSGECSPKKCIIIHRKKRNKANIILFHETNIVAKMTCRVTTISQSHLKIRLAASYSSYKHRLPTACKQKEPP